MALKVTVTLVALLLGVAISCQTRIDYAFKANGGWWRNGEQSVQCGTLGDIPIPADYFNEGQKRLAVFRPSNGYWYIKGRDTNSNGLRSHWGSSYNNIAIQCGTNGDVPVAGDYSGNGVTSIAVWRPSNGYWYIKGPGIGHWGASASNQAIQCGLKGDIPVPMDYFKENKLRMAVFRPSNGYWYIKGLGFNHWGHSHGNIAIQCGTNGDVPVPGDYFGDGVIRLAVWRPSNGVWYIKGKGTGHWGHSSGNLAIQCGIKGDIPVPYDFFGEGKLRIAVYRPSNGFLYIKGDDGVNSWGSSKGNIEHRVSPFVGYEPVNMY